MEQLFSVKMRASRQENNRSLHVSGAERIVALTGLEQVCQQLIERALHHAKGEADAINLKVEKVRPEELLYLEALPVTTVEVATYQEGRAKLAGLLADAGVHNYEAILAKMQDTWGMRGAMLLNVDTLERLEPDLERGIRATYMDLAGELEDSEHKNHFREALVLATKVAHHPNIIGELCISDDPDYVTGYIASKEMGYVRITRLKAMGCPDGGRIFLYRGSKEEVAGCIKYLQEQRVLVHFAKEG